MLCHRAEEIFSALRQVDVLGNPGFYRTVTISYLKQLVDSGKNTCG